MCSFYKFTICWFGFLGVLLSGRLTLINCSRILVSIPLASTRSHYMCFRLVMGALTSRRHEVTFIMSILNVALSHNKTTLDEKFNFILYEGPFDASQYDEILRRFQEQITRKNTVDDRRLKNWMAAADSVSNTSTQNPWHKTAVECDSILGNFTLLSTLKSAKYDLLIGDPAANLCTPLLAEVLSIPFLQYSIQGLRVMHHDRWFNQPIYPSFMPMPLMSFCDSMSFKVRLKNFISYKFASLLIDSNAFAAFEKVKEKHVIRPDASLGNLLMRSQLLLVNSDLRVQEFARPFLPNVIPVGGVTAAPAQPLEKDLQEFFEGSGPHGVVVISMGTSLGFDESSSRDVAGALSRLEQRVLWMHRGTRPTNIGNNTRLIDWITINDVLGHPKTKVLVNHGGTNTVLEAIYHGVPMVLIPLANDMFDITDRAVCRGVALRLNMPTLTGDVLIEAIKKVVSEPGFEETSAQLSAVFKEMTPSPVETAAFWIEHVLKHGGDHLRPKFAESLNIYQSIFLVILFIIGVSFLVFVKVMSYLWRCTKKRVS
ncbi:UDP-glucuronosyltransferase 2C1-like [Patiria miniata]|uniref:Uncharacterized protein n=1 Tax=Patiria miniata TaxID=46514 RepID=A0A914AAL9_PATMI|nr:UDP-glucuronosyltransferase 2C1-like [Patiria miniata]